MCRQVCNESSGASGECCCTGTLSAEDEIRMLEAMKTLEKIRLNGIDRRIEDLRKTVKE
jgi:5-enolpyruvylshikimate-3-phosphate synthase